MASPKTQRCSECPTLLQAGNKSGLCHQHYNERCARRKNETDELVLRALLAGGTIRDVAADLGLKRSRVSRVATNMIVEVPDRRVSDILRVAADLAGFSVADVLSLGRKSEYVAVRQAVYLIGMEVGHSSIAVGRQMGGRDHSTVLSGRDAARKRAKCQPKYAAYLDGIRRGDGAPAHVTSTQPVSEARAVLRVLRPKNDFLPRESSDEDGGHQFQRGIAAGSQKLLDAIVAARAA